MKYLLLFLFLCSSLFASNAFLSTLQLKERLKDPHLLLLDVSTLAQYKSSHISNAVHVDIDSFTQDDEIGVYLRDLGLRKDSQVVIYGRTSPYDLLKTSTLAFILLSHGFMDVSILDGGYTAWVFEYELDVSTELTSKPKGDFIAKREDSFFINAETILEDLEKITLLDSRKSSQYFGTSLSKGVTRAGHIPYAQSAYYQDKFLSDITLRPHEDVQLLFQGLQLKADDTLVVYGRDLREASMNWYLLYHYLGFKNVKIYEGSMLEWGNNPKLPLRKFLWECGK